MAYIAYELGWLNDAYYLWANLNNQQYSDLFMMAAALIRQKQYRQAEKILHLSVNSKWSERAGGMQNHQQRFLLFALLKYIETKQPLALFKSGEMEVLETEFAGTGLPGNIISEVREHICRMYQ